MQFLRCSICIKASRRQGKVNFLQFSNNIKLRAPLRPDGCQCDAINKIVPEEEKVENDDILLLYGSGISLNGQEFKDLRYNCGDCLSEGGKENFDNRSSTSSGSGSSLNGAKTEEACTTHTECVDEGNYDLNKKRAFSTATQLSIDMPDTPAQEEINNGMTDDWEFYSLVGNSIIGNNNSYYYNNNEDKMDSWSDLIQALQDNVARMKTLHYTS